MKINGYANVRFGTSSKAKAHKITGWFGIVPKVVCGSHTNLIHGSSIDSALTNDPVDCARCLGSLNKPTAPKHQPNFTYDRVRRELLELADEVSFQAIYCPYFADAAGTFIKDNDETVDNHAARVETKVREMLDQAKGLADEMEAHGFDRDKAVKSFNRKLNKYRRDCRRTVPESNFAIYPYL